MATKSRHYLFEYPRAEIVGTYQYMDIETQRILRDILGTIAIVLLTLVYGSSGVLPYSITGIAVINSLEVRDVFGAWREYRREKRKKEHESNNNP